MAANDEKLALSVRPYRDRPGKVGEMTPGELLFYALNPIDDEPFARGFLAMIAEELWALFDKYNGEDDARRGLAESISGIARRCEVASELLARVPELANDPRRAAVAVVDEGAGT